MIHLVTMFFNDNGGIPGNGAFWAFLAVGAVVMFGVFIPLVTWIESRRKEREAYYRAETLRRVSEASSEGAKATLELLWEENRQKQVQTREGLKMGGVITLGVGIALMVFLHSLGGSGSPYLVGLIPGLVGMAMLVYVYVMAPPIMDKRNQ
ncbi:MAG: hypothetical protein WAL75_06310 [Terracidiphilus sp.]